MGKHVLGRLAFATMLALITLTAMTASPAAAVTEIDTCQVLDTFGATYRVTQDLSSCDTDCLVVANDGSPSTCRATRSPLIASLSLGRGSPTPGSPATASR